MAKKQVNFKLPEDLVEALDAKAKHENTNRTELVIQGIHYILGLSEASKDHIDIGLYARIEKIESRLHNVETQGIDTRVGDYRLELLENRVSQLEAQSIDIDLYEQLQRLNKQVEALKKI